MAPRGWTLRPAARGDRRRRPQGSLTPAGLLLQLVDRPGGVGLGEVVGDVLAGLPGEGAQVALLCSGGRLVAGHPVGRVLLGGGVVLRLLFAHVFESRRRRAPAPVGRGPARAPAPRGTRSGRRAGGRGGTRRSWRCGWGGWSARRCAARRPARRFR